MLLLPRSVAPPPGDPPASPPKRLVSENDFAPGLSDFICKGERLVCIPHDDDDDVYADVQGIVVEARTEIPTTMAVENFMMRLLRILGRGDEETRSSELGEERPRRLQPLLLYSNDSNGRFGSLGERYEMDARLKTAAERCLMDRQRGCADRGQAVGRRKQRCTEMGPSLSRLEGE